MHLPKNDINSGYPPMDLCNPLIHYGNQTPPYRKAFLFERTKRFISTQHRDCPIHNNNYQTASHATVI